MEGRRSKIGRSTRRHADNFIVITHRSEGGLFEHVFVALQYINLSCETMNISNLDAPGDPNTPCRGIMFLPQLYYHASNRREY